MSATHTHTVTITRRTRNLGFSSTNKVVQYRGGLGVRDPQPVRDSLTPRQVVDAHIRAARGNSGNDWRHIITVAGDPIIETFPGNTIDALRRLLDPEYCDELKVDVANPRQVAPADLSGARWQTPRDCQGQNVECSYAVAYPGRVVEQCTDETRTTRYRVAKMLTDDDGHYQHEGPRNLRWRSVDAAELPAYEWAE